MCPARAYQKIYKSCVLCFYVGCLSFTCVYSRRREVHLLNYYFASPAIFLKKLLFCLQAAS